MVDQVLHFARELREGGRARHQRRVHGHGRAVPQLRRDAARLPPAQRPAAGSASGRASISVSTVGVVPGIDRFAEEPLQLNLAVSLHAGHRRAARPPGAAQPHLPAGRRVRGLRALRAAHAPQGPFEYVVLRRRQRHRRAGAGLAARVRPPLYHLNLIAYNETGGEFARPAGGPLAAFRARLEAAACSCTVRRSPGAEIEAACGQLALRLAARTSACDAARAARRPSARSVRQRAAQAAAQLPGRPTRGRCRCRARSRRCRCDAGAISTCQW